MEMHAIIVNAHPKTSRENLIFIVASFLFGLIRLFSFCDGEWDRLHVVKVDLARLQMSGD
jgi:hypothetical protein